VFCPAPNGAGCVLKTARSAGGILASAEGAESKFFENRRARLTSTTGGALPAGGSTGRTNGGGTLLPPMREAVVAPGVGEWRRKPAEEGGRCSSHSGADCARLGFTPCSWVSSHYGWPQSINVYF
jgi:hypothetical protein